MIKLKTLQKNPPIQEVTSINIGDQVYVGDGGFVTTVLDIDPDTQTAVVENRYNDGTFETPLVNLTSLMI